MSDGPATFAGGRQTSSSDLTASCVIKSEASIGIHKRALGEVKTSWSAQSRAEIGPVGSGKRARNKADKLARISAAARALFVEKGYAATTLRDVAAVGGVGFGTLFDYASDKRDLLFLVCTPQLYGALEEGTAAAAEEALLIEQAMRIFESFYALYLGTPGLWRDFLRELNFYTHGVQALLFLEQRAEFLRRLVGLVRDAATAEPPAAAEVSVEVDAELAGQLMLSAFAWEVRRWLSAEPLLLEDGLIRLRALLKLQIRGLAPDQN